MGVGVGKETATPLAAAIQFFLRDFVAMAGGVIFAAVKGASLDGLAKQVRVFVYIFYVFIKERLTLHFIATTTQKRLSLIKWLK